MARLLSGSGDGASSRVIGTPRSLVSAAKRHTMLSRCGLSSRWRTYRTAGWTSRPNASLAAAANSSNSVRAPGAQTATASSSEGSNRRDAAASTM
ncbi:Uncharacterised protein [Mycobacterium tuberculosis]|nr:Uncharacterised protein [Mycobacterium tuberculosis]